VEGVAFLKVVLLLSIKTIGEKFGVLFWRKCGNVYRIVSMSCMGGVIIFYSSSLIYQ
jgi:hypothetical protein